MNDKYKPNFLLVEERYCNGRQYKNDGQLLKFCPHQEYLLGCDDFDYETKMCLHKTGSGKRLTRLEVEEPVIIGDVPRLEDRLIKNETYEKKRR